MNERTALRLEPRILETVVVAGYRILGREVLWLGGLISSVLWVLGSVALFLIARRLASDLAGLVAVAYFLFLPYGVSASRTFQPDPAMVACMLVAVLASLRYHEHPTRARLLVAAGLSGLAIFIKPTASFIVLATFTSLTIHRRRLHPERGSLSRSLALYVAATLLLPGAYVLSGFIGGNLSSNFRSSIAPRLWIEGFYWRGWLHLVNSTVGSAFAVGALVAVVTARKAEARATALGMWAGYIVLGLVFSYHIHTHDYYHLPLIPIVALGLGLVADAAVARFRDVEIGFAMKGSLALALALVAVMAVVGDLRVARPLSPDARRAEIAGYEEVGGPVGNSTNAVTLAPTYGWALGYHGSIAGWSWPSEGDNLAATRLGGHPPGASSQLDSFIRMGAEWFIVTDFAEWERQLAARAPVAHRSDDFIIYDLRRAR